MFRLKSRLGKGCLFLAILLFSTIVTTIFTSGSTSASQDDIRIGLMMNQSTSSIVTLTSETGLTLGGESGALLNIGDASSLRVSLDQFFIVASETKDISGARTISQTLSQHSFPNVIVQQKKNNETVYRVIASMGATQEEAQKRLQEIRSKAAANATLAGAHRVLAGSFATLEEANARLGQIQAQDYYAYLAQVRTGTALSYQVWVGDGASATEQSTLQNQLQQAFPQITFAPAQADEYILHTSSYLEGNQSGVPYYLTRKKITISPKSVSGKTPLITISEKQNRKYRGQMEISQHNQRFALVNVLPLEHYLYGVVGSELGDSWPIETLKAQAVLARNYAFMGRQANKYGIAHLSDTTADQAYYGFNVEGQNIRNAVDATKGEVLTHNGQVFSTFYYSNAGGMTADGREVWGTAVPTHKVVSSKDSHPADVAATWYRVQDPTGKVGFVHSQYINKTTQTSPLGFSYGTVNTPSLNYRSGPTTDINTNIVGTLNEGSRVLIIEEVKQNNAYSWISGPFSAQEIRDSINAMPNQAGQQISQPVTSLKVTERGESGRATRMEANGTVIQSFRDALRSVFKEGGTRSLRSTKFEVEEMGNFTVLGAGGQKVSYPQANAQEAKLFALRGGSEQVSAVTGNSDQFVMLARNGQVRVASKAPMYRFHGNGFGHGLGVSQWGMRGLAVEGYDYRQILQHYFHKDVKLEKKL